METREITVTIHREPEKRDDLLATLLIVVLAALAFTAGYIAANAQWRETISEVTPEPPVVAQETRAKLLTSYEEPTESITTSRYAEVPYSCKHETTWNCDAAGVYRRNSSWDRMWNEP